MENKDLTIDISMLAISLNAIKENLMPEDFEELLEAMQEANDKGKLIEYLSEAQRIHSEGTDLPTAFAHSFYDTLVNTGEIL